MESTKDQQLKVFVFLFKHSECADFKITNISKYVAVQCKVWMKKSVTVNKSRHIIKFCCARSYHTSAEHQYRLEAVQVYQLVVLFMQNSVKKFAFQESHSYQIILLHDTMGLCYTSEFVSGRVSGSICCSVPAGNTVSQGWMCLPLLSGT